MHPLERLFVDAITKGRRAAEPEDSVAFPPQHARRLLELATEHAASGGSITSHRAMWRFIAEKLPITRGKSCSLDLSHAVCPRINLTGPAIEPVVGKRLKGKGTVVGLWPLPESCILRLSELSLAADNGGPLDAYDLWAFVAEYVPEVMTNPSAGYGFVFTDDNSRVQVVLYADDKAEDE